MGLLVSFGCAFLCFIVTEVVSYDVSARNPNVWRLSASTVPLVRQPYGLSFSWSNPWAEVDVSQPRALSDLNPITVKCGEAQVVVMVNRDLFGTGRLVQAADLTLGFPGCSYTSVDDAKEIVLFEAGLQECGSTLQMTPDSVIYSITLHYKPSPESSSLIVRTSPVEVPIECHYPREDNMSRKTVKPFSITIPAKDRLTFSLRLMKDDWSAERPSSTYQLGDVMHIQADVNTENHVTLRLFIDNCVATPSPGRDSPLQYAFIDYKGCLVDGESDDSNSAFLSPRSMQNTLQFTVDVFRFAENSQDLIYITCHLRVTAADQAPDSSNKACSFIKASNMWSPVEGTQDICSCCETRNCGSLGGYSQRISPLLRMPGRFFQRDASSYGDLKVEAEADVMMGPLFISDVKKVSRKALEDVMKKTNAEVLLWVMGTAAAVSFISAILGFIFAFKKRNNSAV